jgi:hypothetical protein
VIKFLVLAVLAVAGVWLAGLLPGQPKAAEPQVDVARGPTLPAAAGDRTTDISESELTTLLDQQVVGQIIADTPLGPATLEHISAQLRDGRLRAGGDASVASASVPVTMTARFDIENGQPVVIVEDLRAAGVSLPAATRGSVQQTLQRQLDAQLQPLHLRVTSLTIADGTLHVIGSRE